VISFLASSVQAADRMLAAGGGYIRGNTSIEGELSMHSLTRFRNHPPLPQVQIWATEHLIAAEVGDLRWMLVALMLRSAGAALAQIRRRVRRQIALLAAGGASAACEGC
jgi:hypothetical protein